MIRMLLLPAIGFAAAISGCSAGDPTSASHDANDDAAWRSWHADRQSVDRMVETAINEPGGGDYAKAADAIRTSGRPPAVKQFQLGQIIVGANMERARTRPPETLEQGLRMMEDATLAPGEKDQGAVQQLRFLFERGDGTPPRAFPTDPQVAACWLAVEERRSDDPARCIALRRTRLPTIGGEAAGG